MSTLYVFVGIPGSGKSTLATKMCKENPNLVHISSDKIREELYGSEDIQGDGKKVFGILHYRIRKALNNGKDVIYDATNYSYRKDIFKRYGENHKIVAYFFDIPVEEAKRRNALRERVVPEEVIDKMSERLRKPTMEEGFAEIIVIT